MALGDDAPLLHGIQDLGDVVPLGAGLALRRRDRVFPIAPQPAERVGQDRGALDVVVAPVSRDEADVVARVLEGAGHRLVPDPPVAAVDVQVAAAVLEEDADRPRLGLADEGGVHVTRAQSGVGADERQHAPERIGPVPGHRERADASGRGAADGPEARIGGEVQGLPHLGQQLLEQEPGVAVAERVVLEAAVEAGLLVGGARGDHARVDEDADRDRHLAAMDQVVEDHGDSPPAVLGDEPAAVLEHHDRRRRVRPVLRGHVDPVVTLRPREDGARPGVLGDLAARRARLALRVGRERVLGRRLGGHGPEACREQHHECRDVDGFLHEADSSEFRSSGGKASPLVSDRVR